MTNSFTCCELTKRVKNFINESNQKEEEKYQGLEFLYKVSLETANRRVKE